MSPAPAYVAYYRVSTATQGRSGLGLAAQRRSVGEYVALKGGTLIGEYEEWEGGHKPPSARPALAGAIEHSQRSRARLLVARIDRLARSVLIIANLVKSGVDFVAVDLPEVNTFTVHVLAAMAEYERRLNGARIRDALAAYQARGGKIGFALLPRDRQFAVAADGRATMSARCQAFAEKTMPIINEMMAAGLSDIALITRALNRRRIPTMKGRGRWYECVVTAMIRRVDPGHRLVRDGRRVEQAQQRMKELHAETAAQADAFALSLMPTIDALRADGITNWHALARALTARHIPTRRNRAQWRDTSLKAIVERGEAVRARAT